MNAKRNNWGGCATILVTLVLFSASCGPRPGLSTGLVALEGATLLDGTGAPEVENAILLIQGDRVRAVGPARDIDIPTGARRVNLAGKFIIPGLRSIILPRPPLFTLTGNGVYI